MIDGAGGNKEEAMEAFVRMMDGRIGVKNAMNEHPPLSAVDLPF